MEFVDVGKHCEYIGCGQQDFLPFHCDCCKKRLCLSHRTYDAHNCSENGVKNMTSIDCPICGKSIKFDDSQDINVLWEHHFANICIQKPMPAANKNKCSKKSCNTILGPSNTFKCTKCLKSVCLSHRVALDHECESLQNTKPSSSLLDRLDSKPKQVTTSSSQNRNSKSTTAGTVDLTNTLKGSAQRRQQNSTGALPSKAETKSATVASVATESVILTCPFCEFLQCDGDADALLRHVNSCPGNADASTHPAPARPTTSSSASHSLHPAAAGNTVDLTGDTSTSSGAEVCPVCQSRFADAIALVTHFESAHSSPTANSAASITSSAPSVAKGNVCVLS